jgi:hypothetical protein
MILARQRHLDQGFRYTTTSTMSGPNLSTNSVFFFRKKPISGDTAVMGLVSLRDKA